MSDPNEPYDPTPPPIPAPEPPPMPPPPPEPEAALFVPQPAPEPIAPAPVPEPAPVVEAPPPPPPPPPPMPESPMIIGRRRREPEPDKPYDKGGFDAVFEGRSSEGLGDRLLPTTCYLLMIIAPVSLGLLAVPAALLSWMAKDHAPEWLRSHYLFILRTFFTGVLMALVAFLAIILQASNAIAAVAGATSMLILILGIAWFVVRSAVGLGRLRRGEPIRNYRSWTV